MKVGLIGVGAIAGGAHLPTYAALDSAVVVALCDINAQRASGQGPAVPLNLGGSGTLSVQAKPYLDYRDLLADPEVEVVDICLPTYLHAEVTIAALEAGKDVLCEKPMALTVADCDRMLAAATATGRMLMIAQCIRFWPEYVALKGLVDGGPYGRVTSAMFSRLSPLPTASSDGWLLDPARSGGALQDLHLHDADYITYLFGLPAGVLARGVPDAYGISQVTTEYRYNEEMVVYAEGGWSYPSTFPFRMGFRVQFEGATAEWDSRLGPLTVYPADGAPYTPAMPEGTGYFREIVYFQECRSRGVLPEIVTPWEARETVRLIEAERASVISGTVVSLAPTA